MNGNYCFLPAHIVNALVLFLLNLAKILKGLPDGLLHGLGLCLLRLLHYADGGSQWLGLRFLKNRLRGRFKDRIHCGASIFTAAAWQAIYSLLRLHIYIQLRIRQQGNLCFLRTHGTRQRIGQCLKHGPIHKAFIAKFDFALLRMHIHIHCSSINSNI